MGCILLEQSMYVEASDRLRIDDFYLASHRILFERMGDLYRKARSIDFVTLQQIMGQDEIAAVGGVSYICDLTNGLPRRLAIKEYAAIVAQKALLRRIEQTCQQAANRAAEENADPEAILNQTIRSLEDAVLTNPADSDLESVGQWLATNDVFEERTPGIFTGLEDYDEITFGLHPGELTVFAGRTGMGKSLPLDCPIKTVESWKDNADIQIGDRLASIDGLPSMVTGVFPQGPRFMFSVTFADGRELECDGEHLWTVYCAKWHQSPCTMTTLQLMEKLKQPSFRNRIWIDTPSGDFGDSCALPIDPWVLGVLIGDGCLVRAPHASTFSSKDEWIIKEMARLLPESCALKYSNQYDWRINGAGKVLDPALRKLGLLGSRAEHKFIPEIYKLTTRENRRRLLCGLMDTDGWVESTGSLIFASSSEQLALDVQELARSLGCLASISKRDAPKYSYRGESRNGLTAYRVYISHPDSVQFVSLPRKVEKCSGREGKRKARLTISSITPLWTEEAQCIRVSHPSGLFIAGKGYVVTHNTSHCGTIGYQMALRGKCVAIFLNEQQKASFLGRMLCGRSGVSFKSYRRGQLDMIEKIYIQDAVEEFKKLPIFWDQRGSMSVASIRAKAARLKRNGELDVILIDQLSRVSGEGIYQKGMRGDEVIGEKVSAIKGIGVDLGVPVGLYHQLNRDTTRNDESRPTLANLKGSGAIEEHADNVAMFHRTGYYKRDKATENDAEIVIAKQRDGQTGTVHCEFLGYNCRWQNRSKKP